MDVLSQTSHSDMSEHQMQDIARCGYADMLNDDERNRAYFAAIRVAVRHLVKTKEGPYTCGDIGLGSGLLSMMVIKAFMDENHHDFHVYAYEEFKVMANCAKKIILINGMIDYITIIPKCSYSVRREHPKFDLLVAELLDTELTGEGCLIAYRHAIQELCSPSCLFIPHRAKIYIEPVASNLLYNRSSFRNKTYSLRNGKKVDLKFPTCSKGCAVVDMLDDIQASRLRPTIDFKRVCESPKVVHDIVFGDIATFENLRSTVEFKIVEDVDEPIVVAFWWDIEMFDKDVITTEREPPNYLDDRLHVLSCAPTWARSKFLLARDMEICSLYGREVWREHWIQAIYQLHNSEKARALIGTKAGSSLKITAFHDDYAHVFDLNENPSTESSCNCEIHRFCTRSQIGFLNDEETMRKLLDSVLYNQKDNLHLVGDVGIMKYDFPGPLWEITFRFKDEPVNLKELLIEFSMSSSVPWAKAFWEAVLHPLAAPLPMIPVRSLKVKCTQVSLRNLNRIRTNVGSCEGFDLRFYDKLLDTAASIIDIEGEQSYLWEYAGVRVDPKDYEIYNIQYEGVRETPEMCVWKTIRLDPVVGISKKELAKGWALVFWSEIELKHTGEIISTGPIKPSRVGQEIEWFRHCRQIVHFMHHFVSLDKIDDYYENLSPQFEVQVKFEPVLGRVELRKVRGNSYPKL